MGLTKPICEIEIRATAFDPSVQTEVERRSRLTVQHHGSRHGLKIPAGSSQHRPGTTAPACDLIPADRGAPRWATFLVHLAPITGHVYIDHAVSMGTAQAQGGPQSTTQYLGHCRATGGTGWPGGWLVALGLDRPAWPLGDADGLRTSTTKSVDAVVGGSGARGGVLAVRRTLLRDHPFSPWHLRCSQACSSKRLASTRLILLCCVCMCVPTPLQLPVGHPVQSW